MLAVGNIYLWVEFTAELQRCQLDPHATQVAPAEDENGTTPPIFRAGLS